MNNINVEVKELNSEVVKSYECETKIFMKEDAIKEIEAHLCNTFGDPDIEEYKVEVFKNKKIGKVRFSTKANGAVVLVKKKKIEKDLLMRKNTESETQTYAETKTFMPLLNLLGMEDKFKGTKKRMTWKYDENINIVIDEWIEGSLKGCPRFLEIETTNPEYDINFEEVLKNIYVVKDTYLLTSVGTLRLNKIWKKFQSKSKENNFIKFLDEKYIKHFNKKQAEKDEPSKKDMMITDLDEKIMDLEESNAQLQKTAEELVIEKEHAVKHSVEYMNQAFKNKKMYDNLCTEVNYVEKLGLWDRVCVACKYVFTGKLKCITYNKGGIK